MRPHVAARLAVVATLAAAHFDLTWPPSRTRSSQAAAGRCEGSNPFLPLELGTCFWFSQCCTPGQANCTGQFRLPGGARPSPLYCGDAETRLEPALNDPKLRTWRDFGGVDATKYSPWRNPGWAPVLSGCGVAGGWTGATAVLEPVGVAPGFDGAALPPLDAPPVVWERGAAAEVSFSIFVNHGGGYAYRLCPADREPTEACFRAGHLDFVGDVSWIQRGADRKRRTAIAATRVAALPGPRQPAGGAWTKNPIPPCDGADGGDYMAPCETPMWPPPAPELWGIGPGRCFPSNGTTPAGGGGKACSPEETAFWARRARRRPPGVSFFSTTCAARRVPLQRRRPRPRPGGPRAGQLHALLAARRGAEPAGLDELRRRVRRLTPPLLKISAQRVEHRISRRVCHL